MWKSPNEVSRRSVHFLILFVLLVYSVLNQAVDQTAAKITLLAVLLFFLVLEYLRVEQEIEIPFYSKIIIPKEKDRLSSVVLFLIAATICLTAFRFEVALAALLMTTFGDMAASIIGRKYGVTLIFRNKTLVGSVSELVLNLFIAFFVLISITNLYVIMAMAFVATLVEIMVDDLDDNLLGPLFAGFVGHVLVMLL